MERLRIKNLLLACTVMLGLQFCFPIALHAGTMPQVAEMISLGAEDPETKPDAHTDLDATVPVLLALVMCRAEEATVCFRIEADDRAHPSLLPVSGLHPSAP